MNGYTLANYMDQPKGWDYTDVLVRVVPARFLIKH